MTAEERELSEQLGTQISISDRQHSDPDTIESEIEFHWRNANIHLGTDDVQYISDYLGLDYEYTQSVVNKLNRKNDLYYLEHL